MRKLEFDDDLRRGGHEKNIQPHLRPSVRPKRGIPPIAQLAETKSPIAQLVMSDITKSEIGYKLPKSETFGAYHYHYPENAPQSDHFWL